MKNNSAAGVWYAVIAFVMWGFLPLYWKALKEIPAMDILAHRIFWSFIFVVFLLIVKNRWRTFIQVIRDKKSRGAVLISGLLISANWLLYIWAVNTDHVVEASLGYYINPLISIALGMIVLKEKMNFWQLISLLLAVIGVMVITLQFGQAPWIAIFLALSFGFYGLSKKVTKLEASVGLAAETLFLAPLALGFILYKQLSGSLSVSELPLQTVILLIGAGVVTALPLLWFAQATGRVALSTVGFIQYLAPTISLFLGVIVYKEAFSYAHLISFSFIWAALIIYSFSQSSFFKNHQPKLFKQKKEIPE